MENVNCEFKIPHYSEMLLGELKSRCSKNRNYSLRSLARDLKISPSFLSRILRRENSVSLKGAESLLKYLKWSKSKKNLFVLLVQFFNCPPGEIQDYLYEQIKKSSLLTEEIYFDLTKEHEAILGSWYHLAIVELTLHPDFNDSPIWIAKRLGLTLEEVRQSIQRLLMLGLLHHNGRRLVRNHNRYWIGNFHSSQIRNFHHQHLKLASKALKSQSMSERMFMGSTFPMPLDKMNQINELIQEFHSKVLNLVEQTKPDQIYHLAIQLYRLDQPNSNISKTEESR